MRSDATAPCPCGGPGGLAACCGPVIAGAADAATAEELMRSRFTAFVLGDADYLARSWAPESCPAEITIDPDREWTTLEIVDTVDGQALAALGVVAFRAHYEHRGVAGVLEERSNFRREAGRWVYVDGAVR